MGANQSNPNPIRNLDKRTARREYRSAFTQAIASYRVTHPSTGTETPSLLEGDAGKIIVCVRKRPIFEHETKNFEFDVITCRDGNSVVVHDARMHSDMRRQFIRHHEFGFHRTFGESCDNNEVYMDTVHHLVKHVGQGHHATCLMYGATGSGKTYTMSYIYERAAHDIFTMHPNLLVSLSFVEIAGDHCSDLLNSFNALNILSGKDGNFFSFPTIEPSVSSAQELYALIRFGCMVRATAATGVHDASSRTHAILSIYLRNPDNTPVGELTLVDLAGSEHRIDSMHHNINRRKETALINSSLMALKECIRSRSKGAAVGHYYRKSKLTMMLKSSFADMAAKTVVIVTVSPASKDTEHSLNSLRHACLMDGQSDADETRFVTGGVVNNEFVGEVDVTGIARSNLKAKKANAGVADLKNQNGNKLQANDPSYRERTPAEIEKGRRVAERKALAALHQSTKALLLDSRQHINDYEYQRLRIQIKSFTLPEHCLPSKADTEDDVVEFAADQDDEEHTFNDIPQPGAATVVAAKNDKNEINYLRKSVFSDETTPKDILLRRFRNLLKQKGYSKEVMDREAPLQQEASDSITTSPITIGSNHNRLQFQPATPTNKTRSASQKVVQQAPAASPVQDEMTFLENELKRTDITAATRHGLKRRLATHQAAIAREKRKAAAQASAAVQPPANRIVAQKLVNSSPTEAPIQTFINSPRQAHDSAPHSYVRSQSAISYSASDGTPVGRARQLVAGRQEQRQVSDQDIAESPPVTFQGRSNNSSTYTSSRGTQKRQSRGQRSKPEWNFDVPSEVGAENSEASELGVFDQEVSYERSESASRSNQRSRRDRQSDAQLAQSSYQSSNSHSLQPSDQYDSIAQNYHSQQYGAQRDLSFTTNIAPSYSKENPPQIEIRMNNTSAIESVLSPKKPKHVQHSHQVQYAYEPPPLDALPDALDSYLPNQQIHEQMQQPTRAVRGRRQYGASSAPFANDMNWNI